jgi:uncharacterized protein YifE (UPF0438 family)
MPKIPPDHLEYLNQRPFSFRCSTEIFPSEEMQALTEMGNWLEALAAGKIQPLTAEQEHFLKVDHDEAEPATVHEHAWLRLKGRREFEEQKVPATEPEDDHGMVEWDADRCWW